jgi:hypothetical protein
MVKAECSLKTLVMLYQTVPLHTYQATLLNIPDDNNCQLFMWGFHIFYLVMVTAGAEVYDALRLATCLGYVNTGL